MSSPKKHIVYLTYDEMMSIWQLANMFLVSGGTPKVLTQMPLSDEFKKDLSSIYKQLDEAIDEVNGKT